MLTVLQRLQVITLPPQGGPASGRDPHPLGERIHAPGACPRGSRLVLQPSR